MAILRTRETWRKPKGAGSRTPDLTDAEIANVKRAICVMRIRLGSHAALATALGTNAQALKDSVSRSRKPSVALALRVSRVVGVPLEDVLSGAWPPEGSCPHCGRL